MLVLRLKEVVKLSEEVVEASLVVLEDDCVLEVADVDESEFDVGVKENDELDEVTGVELGVDDVETGVDEGEGVSEEDEESLVGVAEVLAGVDELAAALLTVEDEAASLVTPTSDNTDETAELITPCRLIKGFSSSQLACASARSIANIDSRRT